MLPNPWAILGALGVSLALIIGSFFYGQRIQATADKVAIEKLNVDAANLLTELTATALAKDALASEHARDLDEKDSHEKQAVATIADAARSTYSIQLRDIRSSWKGCESARATETVNSKYAADADAARINQLFNRVAERLDRVGRGAEELKVTLGTCRAWVLDHGR